jgi:hypothetical protein
MATKPNGNPGLDDTTPLIAPPIAPELPPIAPHRSQSSPRPRRRGGGPPPARRPLSFSAFLRARAFEPGGLRLSGDMLAWMTAADIGSRDELLHWFRDRRPWEYRTASLLSGGRTGRELMEELWAGYLQWSGARR